MENHLTSSLEALKETRLFLIKHTTTVTEGQQSAFGWRQFLDETDPPYIGTYGTACGIVALTSCGENPGSSQLQKPIQWLQGTQLPEGCWVTKSLRDAHLTTITTWALEALVAAGYSNESENVRKAVEWLCRTQHKKGAWGNYYNNNTSYDEEDQITPTCLAISALSKVNSPEARECLRRAIERLTNLMQGQTEPAYVALGVIALAQVSEDKHSSLVNLMAGRLLKATDISLGDTLLETYYVPVKSGEVIPVNYHLHSPALILRAICTAKEYLAHESVKRLVNGLSRAMSRGYIEINRMPRKVPIWAIAETCRAIQYYVRSFVRQKDYVTLYQLTHDLLDENRKLAENLETVRKKVVELEKKVEILGPFLRAMRRYGVYLAIGGSTASYIVLRLTTQLPLLFDIGAALLAGGLTAIQILSERGK